MKILNYGSLNIVYTLSLIHILFPAMAMEPKELTED